MPNISPSGFCNGSTLKMDRRGLLRIIWLTATGILVAGFSAVGVLFSLPPKGKNQFGGVVDMGPLSELPSAGDPPINHPAGRFWLIHTSEGFSALYKACTHLDCLFDWNAQERRFICPCHGSRFEHDGKLVNGPATRSLDRFFVQIVNAEGKVVAETDPDTGLLPTTAVQRKTALEKESASDGAGRQVGYSTKEVLLLLRVDTSRRIAGAPHR